ncbi:MAG: VCBS domain-containing protein [Sulfuritalea sp.]|nr:VCBS domain-containing protein [Sulfuritalea sp.]
MDDKYYAYDAKSSDQQNLLINLIRSEQSAAAGQGKLTHMAADFQKLGASIAGLDIKAQDALIAQAIEWYYWKGADYAGEEFFTRTGELLQYEVDPSHVKAFRYVDPWLDPIAKAHGEEFLYRTVADYEQWNVSAGSSGVTATARDATKTQIFLGTAGADNFTGGQEKDILFGGADADTLNGGGGDDRLYGGKGNDTLIGGDGFDTYVINSGDGTDTIIDSGTNRLIFNGRPFVGTFIKNADTGEYEFHTDTGKTIKFNSPGTLTLDADTQIIFQNQTTAEALDGSFGLQLHEETAAPVTSRTITDIANLNLIDDRGLSGIGPYRTGDPEWSGGITDEHIEGLGGDDFIISWYGRNDIINGGDGNDWILTMASNGGSDVVTGGAGRDVIVEGDGDDKLYAGDIITVTDALAAENATPTGLQGEALSGGAGDDLAIGGTGNDVLFGGLGDDILIAGAGDDNIDGDAMAGNIVPDWSVTRTASGNSYLTTYTQFIMYQPTEGGADAIYAGAGADWVTAGYGNDYVDGGEGDDVLFGGAGNDDLFGGAGNDIINGDTASLPLSAHGDDYLDGEDGNDTLFGGGGQGQLFGGTGADQLYGNEGSDYLDGEDGDDILVGGHGADELFGGDGADFLQGDAGNGVGDGADYLDGEAGDDILLGLGGADTLYGGDGNDQIAGDNGGTDSSGAADTIFGEAGNDFIDGQGGDDVIDAGADNDIVAGGLGNDQLFGGAGSDQLQGGEGNDLLDGGSENDTLFGEAGNDTLKGGAGNDYLLGGLGNDILDGGEGDDVYFYARGEGNDRIVDSGGTDWLVFNDISWGQITLGVGSLKLKLPDGAELHLDDFDPDNPYAAGGIEYFQFADGAVLSKSQLIDALGIQPTGTPEADVLSGTALSETIDALAGDDVVTARAGNDTIYAGDGNDVVYAGEGNDVIFGGNGDDVLLGEAGNDTLYGEAGNDLLSGGAGSDMLQGGEGDDIYLFQSGDGQDTATDALGTNSIALGTGLTLDAIVFSRAGDNLQVSVKNSDDRLTVTNWFAADSHFASLSLGDGTLLDHAGVETAMPQNQAPLAAPDSGTAVEDAITEISGNALANDSDPEGRALRVTNPGIYAGSVGALVLSGGGGWSYVLDNDSSAVQSLGAGQALTESFAYTVTDDDPSGAATAASSIQITVQGTNDLPLLGSDSAATSEDAAPISGNLLSNDSDIDAGSALTIANPGTKVGAYGTLDLAADGAWSYALDNASNAVQALAAGQTVTENFAQTVSDGIAQVGGNLAISIAGRNDAPILVTPLADQSAAANTSWSWALPAGSFSDVDAGDVLGYGASLADGTALPSWLTFDAATQTFSGRVPKTATGSLDIRVAASDRAGESVADVFTLSFAAGGGGGGGGGGNGGGGGSQGNEGVGNGVDGPPPGHDVSFNDGPGTGPGNPGAQGGNGYRPPNRADVVMSEVRVASPILEASTTMASHGNSAEAHAVAPGQIKQAENAAAEIAATGASVDSAVSPAPTFAATATEASGDSAAPDMAGQGNGVQTGWLTEAAWAYLDSRGTDSSITTKGNSGDSVAAFARWLAVEQALARDAANGLPDWLDHAKGADLSGLLASNGGLIGTGQILGDDMVGLLAGGNLKGFKGLGEGVRKIA